MIFSLKGYISYFSRNYIVIDVDNVGYLVYVSNPDSFLIGKEYFLYIYHHFGEVEQYLIGFKSIEEKNLFLKLIKVKGIGPKTALVALSKGNFDEIEVAIKQGNSYFLKTMPGIGEKNAYQILHDMKIKKDKQIENNEVLQALLSLGFKKKEIETVLKDVYNLNLSKEEMIKSALIRLNNKYGQ